MAHVDPDIVGYFPDRMYCRSLGLDQLSRLAIPLVYIILGIDLLTLIVVYVMTTRVRGENLEKG